MLAFMAHYWHAASQDGDETALLPEAIDSRTSERMPLWADEFHGAGFLRGAKSFRSWCAKGADGPLALCVPPEASDLAEWLHQLTGELITPAPNVARPIRQRITMLNGTSFVATSENVRIASPYAEGEEISTFARQQFAVAALPDERSLLVLEYTDVLREITFDRITGINWKVPNDLFNGNERRYDFAGKHRVFRCPATADEVLDTGSDRVTADNRLSLMLLYGANSLKIHHFAQQNVRVTRFPFLSSLHADLIGFEAKPRRARAGELLLDTGCAVATLNTEDAAKIRWRQLELPGLCRGIDYWNWDGKRYRFTANFGLERSEGLEPGEACLET